MTSESTATSHDSSLQRSSELTRFRLAPPNPGPMSLDGTNSYVIGAPPGSRYVAVVDPGPEDEQHLAVLASAGVVDVVSLRIGMRITRRRQHVFIRSPGGRPSVLHCRSIATAASH